MTLKTMRGPAPTLRARQAGLTLIELLVSLAIGLVIMVAIVSAYVGAAGSSRVAESYSRMNEDAQAALTILSQHLRMAGNNPKQNSYAVATPRNPAFGTGTFALRGCDGNFSNLTSATDIASLTCSTTSGVDSIAVAYEADRYNTVPDSTGTPTDCLGQALPTSTGTVNAWNGTAVAATSVTFSIADNRFYVGTSTAITTPSLFCKGNGGSSPQPLVENVEDMQFIYGVAPSTASSTLTVAGYLTATQVITQTDLAALTSDALRWDKVATVRVCVLIRSENAVAPDASSARYVQCDGTINESPPDLRLRRAYSTTVVLRNRMGS